jgi:hypothetical protein
MCEGKKGPKYINQKYCGKCLFIVRKARADIEHARNIARKYGITGEQYLALHKFQGGRCAICRRATGRTRRLCVDHDHKTGKVRGLLCRPCNSMLGHLRDDPDAFRRAALYLEATPWVRYLRQADE